jgi:hypothetical protein
VPWGILRASGPFQHSHGGLVAILGRTVNFCWFCFKWSFVLAVVAGGAAALYFYQHVDNEICRQIETKIAKHYSNLSVHLCSAQLVDGKGIVVRGLTIGEPGAEGPRATLLSVAEIFIECPTDWSSLAGGEPDVRRVIFRQAVFHATRCADGTFSTGKLLPPPHFGERSPDVIFENGTVEIYDPLKHPASSMVFRDFALTLLPASADQPKLGADTRQLQGTFVGDHVRCVKYQGLFDTASSAYTITGDLEGLEFSPDFYASLPEPLSAKLNVLRDLRGQSSIHFRFDNVPTSGNPPQFDLTGNLTRARLEDDRLPHPLTDIQAAFHVNNSGFAITDFFARSNRTTLRCAGQHIGFQSNGPLSINAEVRQLELDRALLDILPASLQEQWRTYWPSGQIDADVKLNFDGQTWRRDIAVQCLNVTFTPKKFQYRFEYGKGTLSLKDNKLNLDLTAYMGSQPVSLAAELEHVDENPTGWFEAKAADIEVDHTLIDALALYEGPQKVVRSLDPRGTVDIYAKYWRERSNEPIHQHLRIAPTRCSIRYDLFPYPITGISGTIEMLDQTWTLSDLAGKHNGATVRCEGLVASGLQGNELTLNIHGTDVPLEDELRESLPFHIRQVWRDVRPRGVVDLTVNIRYLLDEHQMGLIVRAEPHVKSVSIEPVQFPYRLDNFQGALVYRDGCVTLEGCKADHGAVRVGFQGDCNFQPDGQWNMRFTGLTIDKLRPDDRELLQALPERLRRAFLVLNLTSPLNLRGSLEFEHSGSSNEPLHMKWNMNVGMQQARLQCGSIPFENINGVIGLVGGFDGRQALSRGELNLDSVNYKDCLFTQVKGPLWFEDGRVLFGSLVDQKDGPNKNNAMTGLPRTPSPIAASAFGGMLYSDGWVLLGAEPRYGVGLTLANADLTNCFQEIAGGRQKVQGRVQATVSLSDSQQSFGARRDPTL